MGDRKSAVRVEIKDADKGEVDLVFATFNAWDKDQDWTEPGAFTDGAKVPVSAYGHKSWEGALPVGIAELSQTPREAQARAKFFMDTPDGAATFKTVKRLHEAGLGDWSYGYRPKTWEMGERDGQRGRILKAVDVDEISPVLVGAGVGTRTLSAKAAGRGDSSGSSQAARTYLGVMAPHETLTEDVAWRPDDAVKSLGLAPSILDLRATHAYVDPDSNPELKASYHFLHHAAPDGPANIRACMLGIAVLNGALGGGVGIPDDAKAGVYSHLAGHLRDADVFVPELRTKSGGTLKTADQALVVLADLGSLISRMAEVGASRALKGERLTKAQRTILGWIDEDLSALKSLLAEPQENVERELLRFIKLTRGEK